MEDSNYSTSCLTVESKAYFKKVFGSIKKRNREMHTYIFTVLVKTEL